MKFDPCALVRLCHHSFNQCSSIFCESPGSSFLIWLHGRKERLQVGHAHTVTMRSGGDLGNWSRAGGCDTLSHVMTDPKPKLAFYIRLLEGCL